ncbi:O-antigen ligase family protein [Hoeflea sp. Naph1]|uniref:O-antigen ligase family protein n=1 Tax=Hoeflea sp. Naph1 TaxID=3388653 RepID=UPI00399017B2
MNTKKQLGVNSLNILLMISLAAILSIPNAYTIIAAITAVIGIYYLSKRLLTRAPLFESHLSGKLCLIFMAYALICASIQYWHRAPLSHYEMYIPFLWAPLIVLAVIDGRIDRRPIWLGCMLGAVFACILALFQSTYLGVPRPFGFLGSPVTFGNNALLLGSVAVAGRNDPPFNLRKPIWLAMAYMGFFSGVTASVITQSKGGWPLIPIVLIWVLVEDFWRASRQGRLSIIIAVCTSFCLLPFMPISTALSRINSAAIGTVTWFQTGAFVEGSAAPRLELWKFGLTIWPEKPWLGHSREGVVQRIQEKIAQNEINPGIENLSGLHNEAIQLLAEQGLIGFFSWALMFGASIFVFGRAYLRDNRVQQTLGQAGLITITASLIFGLSDHNFMLNANRQIFVFLMMAISALVVAERNSFT